MEPAIFIRLAMTIAILAGLWIQLPRFTKQLEEKGRANLPKQHGKKKDPARDEEIIAAHVSRGRKVLIGTFLGMVVLAWVLPLPF